MTSAARASHAPNRAGRPGGGRAMLDVEAALRGGGDDGRAGQVGAERAGGAVQQVAFGHGRHLPGRQSGTRRDSVPG